MDVAVQTLWFLQLFCIVWSTLSYPWNHVEVAPLSKAVLKNDLSLNSFPMASGAEGVHWNTSNGHLFDCWRSFCSRLLVWQGVSSQIIDVCRLYMGRRVVSFTVVYCWFSTVSTSANLFYHGKRWFCVCLLLIFFFQDWKLSFSIFFFQFDKRNQISGGGVEFVFGGHGFVVWFGFFFLRNNFLVPIKQV